LEWNAANHIGQSRAEEHGQERTGEKEQTVKERPPYAVVDVHAQFNAGAAHDEQPQHNHQGQIETAERGRVKGREGKVESAAAGQQPDFVAVPDRTNASEHDLPVGFAARQQRMQDADAQVEAVEHDIGGQHDGDDPEPDKSHSLSFSRPAWGQPPPAVRRSEAPLFSCQPQPPCPGIRVAARGAAAADGPSLTARYTSTMNRIESTVYIPMKPSKVNSVLPADTFF